MNAPLPALASVTVGAVMLPPIVGAAVAVHQHGWEPLAYGALCAAGLLVALVVGSGVVDARKARKTALRAENGVHPDPEAVEALVAERDRLREALAHLQACWLCGADPKAVAVVRPRSESGEPRPDVTDATESPGPATGGA